MQFLNSGFEGGEVVVVCVYVGRGLPLGNACLFVIIPLVVIPRHMCVCIHIYIDIDIYIYIYIYIYI